MSTRLAALAVLSFALPAAAFAAAPAPSSTLTVKIEGVTKDGGDLRVGVYDEKLFEVRGSKPLYGIITAAKPGEDVIRFPDVAPGTYGVKILQDVNKNGHMDLHFGMFPAEPYGISNDARPSMGPAPWDDAKFDVKSGANAIVIHMHE